MKRQSQQTDYSQVLNHLADLLGMDPRIADVKRNHMIDSVEVDMILDFEGLIFVAELKRKGDTASVGKALRHAARAAKGYGKQALPLIVVPYMGQVGKELCEEAGACWIDLSGNALLHGRPGLRIQIEGKPNQFKSPGRPQNLFAPKSSRIARCLLMSPEVPISQRELAKKSGLDEGFTSRIIREMEAQDLIVRNDQGAVKVATPKLMLEAWREAYNFNKHRILKGHVPARSGAEALKSVAAALKKQQKTYAATGLAAAWQMKQFAGYRLAVVYHKEAIPEATLNALNFQEDARGANLWLVQPNDNGVFQGAKMVNEIQCVHPVQVFVDLKQHPERSEEAAENLLETLFPSHMNKSEYE
jgi:hypothetical protein